MNKAISISDREIIESLRNNPAPDGVIRFLYRQHFRDLSIYVLNNQGNAADAEDIFQEVLIAFINLVRVGKFREESGIRTFLYALNRNIWLNELKKRKSTHAREVSYESLNEKDTQAIDLYLSNRETENLLVQVIHSLGENCKQILLLFYYEEKSMKEILQKLPYENEQVVRNKKHKCMKKMEELVRSNAALYKSLKTYLHG